MNLFGLLDNAAQVFNVVKKNSQASDNVAGDFLKSKRSLGSNDRRFVLDLLFFTLRNLKLTEHIAKKCIENPLLSDTLSDFSKNESAKAKDDDLITIFTAFILATQIHSFAVETNFDKYLNKKELSFNNSVSEIFIESLVKHNQWTRETIINWIEEVNNLFHLILSSSITEISNNSNFDLNDYNNSILLYSFPDWIINNILSFHTISTENIFKLAESFTKSAPITIRINNRFKNSEEVISELEAEGIDISKGCLSPTAYHLSRRIYLSEHPLYKSGAIEIQDEASQLVSFALAPDPSDVILDACAGAGGKSVHLAALQNDSGTIIATDKELRRLKEIPARAANGGFSSINTYIIGKNGEPTVKDGNIKYFKRRSFNAVLVDAPCSGMGTLRREPMKKYRVTPRLIEKMSQLQFEILCNYSDYLNIGGTLIYATCSIMPQENDIVVERFLEENPDFAPDSLYDAFAKNNIVIPGLKENDWKLTLYPHQFGTDGFFIARMKKIG